MRLHIEQLILSCYLNQHRTTELDEMEFRDSIIPFELFKASMTTKMTAKAIYNLQKGKKGIDEVTVLNYIQNHTNINVDEWLEICSKSWCTFDTMQLFINDLRVINDNEIKANKLKAIR